MTYGAMRVVALVALPVWVGALRDRFGFSALGIAAVVIAALSCFFFAKSKANA